MLWLKGIFNKKPIVLDANAVLRYLLNDNEDQHNIISDLIASYKCIVYLEVIEEVVFVLEKHYKATREEIRNSLLALSEDVKIDKINILQIALDEYCKPPKVDFVDCLLCGYTKTGRKVFSFDKKLNRKSN